MPLCLSENQAAYNVRTDGAAVLDYDRIVQLETHCAVCARRGEVGGEGYDARLEGVWMACRMKGSCAPRNVSTPVDREKIMYIGSRFLFVYANSGTIVAEY